MATMNLFELLGGDDAEDPSQLVAASQKVEKAKKAPAGTQAPAATQAKSGAKFPTKPVPPAQAVKEARNDTGRGGGRGGRGYGGGRGGREGGGYNRGRDGGGYSRDSGNNENTYGNNGFSGGYSRPSEDGEGRTTERRGGYGGPRGGGGGFRGGRRGDFNISEGGEGERPRRTYERHSGTGRGNEFKREGAGRGNWGTPDEIIPEGGEAATEIEKNVVVEKQLGDEDATDIKEAPATESEEKEQEEKEMTLEEYEKVLEEKRKALLALKTEERKVNVDKEFESMQQLSNKKSGGDEIFIKLGSEKDKKKEAAEKEEKAKKSVNIIEFLKPAERERYHGGGGGRGRGRGRGGRGGGGFSHGGHDAPPAPSARAPSIQDPDMFPSLGGGK